MTKINMNFPNLCTCQSVILSTVFSTSTVIAGCLNFMFPSSKKNLQSSLGILFDEILNVKPCSNVFSF